MVKSLTLVLLALSLSACPTDPPACVFLTCDAGSDCPNGQCGSDGICQYPDNAACTNGGAGTGTVTTSTSAGSTGTGTGTSGGVSGTAGGGTSGGAASTGGGGTTGQGTTGGMGSDAGCLNPCAHCNMGGVPCCPTGHGGGMCDGTFFVCTPPSGGASSCDGGQIGGGTTGGGGNACVPLLSSGDGGFCSPVDGGCFCGADYDCCGGCCDLSNSNSPGVCVSGGGIAPGFHRGPQPSGGNGGLGGSCTPPVGCNPLGGICSTVAPVTVCCGQKTGAICLNSACCQDFDAGCVNNLDCCNGRCSPDSFTCR